MCNKRTIRVVLFTNLFPNPGDVTRGIFSYQLVKELLGLCNVTVVCPLPWFPRWRIFRRFKQWFSLGQVPNIYEVLGVQVYSPKYLMLPRISGRLQSLLMFLGAYRTVRRLHASQRCDVINALWLYPDAVAAGWIARRLGIPMLPAARGCDVNRLLIDRDKRGQILAMLQKAPTIFAVSEALCANMVAAGIPKQRIATIMNGVNSELFYVRAKPHARSELSLPADRQIIVFVGRLSEEKGLSTLINVVAKLLGRRSDFTVYLIGDGPMRCDLERMIEMRGLATYCKLCGSMDHHKVAEWVAACDLVCVPSLREGCPNIVLEALSSGRPVVASRVGGIPELVHGFSGILVEPENEDQFCEALDEGLLREWNQQQIAESVKKRSWRAVAEQYHAIYCSVVLSGEGPT